MEIIKIVLDRELLNAVDVTARRCGMNRSELIREALREYVRCLHVKDLEERDRRGYQAHPQCVEEYRAWEEAAAWPG